MTRDKWGTGLNFVLSQICWFACVLGAAKGQFLLGPVVTLGVALFTMKRAKDAKNEGLFLVCATVAGTLLDLVSVNLGAYAFVVEPATPWAYPLWMSALWLAFATTIRHSLDWLGSHRAKASLFGLIGGPLAYSGGASLGPISLGSPRELSLLIIGFVWMLAMPGLFWFSASLKTFQRS